MDKPFLKVLSGNPEPAQVAALTLLFASMSGNEPEPTRNTNMWGNVSERLRRPTMYNPNAFHNVSFY